MVKVFRIISKESTAEPWDTNNQEMDEMGRLKLVEASWKNEEYNRGLKQVKNKKATSAGRPMHSAPISDWYSVRSWVLKAIF